MRVPFPGLCELWETLIAQTAQGKSGLIRRWFKRHATDILRQGPSALALLSCLFPEKRPDRDVRIAGKEAHETRNGRVRSRQQPREGAPKSPD